jgi:hypothetical protein
MKSSGVRKKSTSSSSTADEDDISNIPSLQMRIQIISQRVSTFRVHLNSFENLFYLSNLPQIHSQSV